MEKHSSNHEGIYSLVFCNFGHDLLLALSIWFPNLQRNFCIFILHARKILGSIYVRNVKFCVFWQFWFDLCTFVYFGQFLPSLLVLDFFNLCSISFTLCNFLINLNTFLSILISFGQLFQVNQFHKFSKTNFQIFFNMHLWHSPWIEPFS